MNRSTWWSAALFGLVVLCAPTLASAGQDAPAKKPKAQKVAKDKPDKPPALKGEYAIMAKVLEMDADQTAKFTEAYLAYSKALKAWSDGDSGKKLAELTAAAKKAREDKDKDKIKALSDEMKPLMKERSDLQEAQKANLLAVLTPEQKAKYAEFSLYRSVMGRYKRANPTDDQDKQIRSMCAAACKDMPDSSDKKAHSAAMKKLTDEIEQKVLTDAQREELKKPRTPKETPAKDKPAAKKAGAGESVIVK